MSLTVTTDPSGQVRIVPAGVLDVRTVGRFRAAVVDVLAVRGTRVLADLSRVTFVDSAGLGVLLGAHRAAIDAGGSLTVTGLCPSLVRLVRVSGLDRVLVVVPRSDPTGPALPSVA